VELGNALAANGCADESVEICHRLGRDGAALRKLGTDLCRALLLLPVTDEVAFLRGIRDLLRRAWTERCRACMG
jgi:hypothetical protein